MSVKALVDCRVTGEFINSEYIISWNLPVCWLSQLILVLNIDGSPNLLGGISGMVNMVVDYKGHSKQIQLAVMCLGKQHIILGHGSKNIIWRLTERPRSPDDMLSNELQHLP
jgi:hypothetical protein